MQTETMGARLRRLRVARGIEIKEMAIRLNMPANTYRDWEKESAIQGQPYINLALALDVSVNTVLGASDAVSSNVLKAWLIKDLDQILTRLP